MVPTKITVEAAGKNKEELLLTQSKFEPYSLVQYCTNHQEGDETLPTTICQGEDESRRGSEWNWMVTAAMDLCCIFRHEGMHCNPKGPSVYRGKASPPPLSSQSPEMLPRAALPL